MDENKQLTIDTYNAIAAQRKTYYKQWGERAKAKSFELFLEQIPGKQILDVGCAQGHDANYFVEQGMAVLGIDYAENMVAIARESNIDAHLMDVEKLTLPNNSFDGVWAAASLLHVPKERFDAVVSALSAVLRANGVLHISVKRGSGEHIVTEGEMKRYFVYWTERELVERLLPHFTIIAAWEEPGKDDEHWVKVVCKKN